jgi:hypothetical protein
MQSVGEMLVAVGAFFLGVIQSEDFTERFGKMPLSAERGLRKECL